MGFLSSLVEQDIGRALANLGNLDQCAKNVYKVSKKLRDKKKEKSEEEVCLGYLRVNVWSCGYEGKH